MCFVTLMVGQAFAISVVIIFVVVGALQVYRGPLIRRQPQLAPYLRYYVILMIGPDTDIICWNVHGLNQQARKDVVHQLLANTSCSIACIQEIKLQSIDGRTASYLGAYKLNRFEFAPATGPLGTRGAFCFSGTITMYS